MRRTLLLLAALSAVVLGLAALASWLLTEEPSAELLDPAPASATGPRAATRSSTGEVAPDEEPRAAQSGEGARVDAGRGPAQVEVADSPFLTEQGAELDYAVVLVFGPNATPDTWRNAAEVFERCLKQVPGNQRCYRGLIAAQSKLAGHDAGITAADLAAPPLLPDDDSPRRLLVNPAIDLGTQRPVERR